MYKVIGMGVVRDIHLSIDHFATNITKKNRLKKQFLIRPILVCIIVGGEKQCIFPDLVINPLTSLHDLVCFCVRVSLRMLPACERL